MKFAVIASDNFFNEFEKLNYAEKFLLTKIPKKTTVGLVKEFESDHDFDMIFIEVKEIASNSEAICQLLERLSKTIKAPITMVASDYMPESAAVKDMYDSGAKYVITSESENIKTDIMNAIVKEGLWNTALHSVKNGDEPCKKDLISSTYNDSDENEIKQEPPEVRLLGALDKPIVPPSQVPRSVAKARIPKKPVPKPDSDKALSIAFAGAGTRIGTTTQVMQLALFLLAQDESVAVMQLFGKSRLDTYVGITNSVLVDDEHYRIDGVDLFRSGKNIAKVKAEYRYIIFDYGDFNVLSDVTSFLDKDICIVVGGIKPAEISELDNIFNYDNGSLFYIFSFVPQSDMQSVLSQMENSSDKTFFAKYAPDYWQYCGDDETYSALLSYATSPSNNRKNATKQSFLSRIPFFNL